MSTGLNSAAITLVFLAAGLGASANAATLPTTGGRWETSSAEGGTRYVKYHAAATLMGQPSKVTVAFFCNPLRAKDENGALGFDLSLSNVAALKPFAFGDFDGPDATVSGKKMRVIVTRAGLPDLQFDLAPNGSYSEEDVFTFGVAELSHVPVSDPKSILRGLAAGASTFRVVITDPRNAGLKLEVQVPVDGKAAEFQALLKGVPQK